MPQMAPIAWLSLFMMFTLIFLMFSVMNYYCFMPNTPSSSTQSELKINSMNWKW